MTFHPHDGQGMPCDYGTEVEVITALGERTGSRIRKLAGELDSMAESPWIWRYEKPTGMDIVWWREV